MKKYSKKIALILALSLTLAFAIPALATDTVVTGTYQGVAVEVVLPSNTNAVVNPYALPLAINTDAGTPVAAKVQNSQIVVDTPLTGYNYGSVPMKIGANVKGAAKANFKLASDKPDKDATSNTGLVYFEIKSNVDLGYTNSPDTTCIGAFNGDKVVAALNGWEKTTYRESAKDQIIVKNGVDVKKTEMVTIAAVDETSGLPTNASCFLARLSGDIVKAPKTPWTTADGVDVTITWIIEPDL